MDDFEDESGRVSPRVLHALVGTAVVMLVVWGIANLLVADYNVSIRDRLLGLVQPGFLVISVIVASTFGGVAALDERLGRKAGPNVRTADRSSSMIVSLLVAILLILGFLRLATLFT